MKIFLKDLKTGSFYSSDLGWNNSIREALDFQTVDAALSFCEKSQLKEVEVLLHFDDGDQDLRLPVPPQNNSNASAIGIVSNPASE